MKILYAIQGTGNGHISRSKEVLKYLVREADVDILVSERQHEVNLGFKVKYQLEGLGFVFGKTGGIDYYNSIIKARPNKFLLDIYDLPVDDYDVVVSDFEPIASWACKRKKKPYISLSHQAAFISDLMPRPEKINTLSEFIIKWYAPVSIPIGLHYEKYDNFIETPIIREDIRNAELKNMGHYTVYLPSFDEKYITERLNRIDAKWELFSKHYKGQPYNEKNVTISPINNEHFVKSLATCEGILCNSGFETPSEALYLGKKILTIPMKGQYEQECNAEALRRLGIKVLSSIDDDFEKHLEEWLNSDFIYPAEFKNNVPFIIDFILESSNTDYIDKEPVSNFKIGSRQLEYQESVIHSQ